MNEKYKTVLDYGVDEFIVNKSHFIGYAKPVKSEEDALEFIEKKKSKHSDATHNVYAYVIGQESNIQRFSDDGEPSGTAGMPALDILKKEELRNTVVVITRYFGGVKLGGGGLIRAYAKGAKIAVEAAKIVDMELHQLLEFSVNYDQYGRIENELQSNNLPTEDIIFEEDVTISLYIKMSEVEQFKSNIANLTNGDAIISDLGTKHLPTLEGKRIKL